MHFKKQKTLRFKPLEEIDLNTIPEPLTWHLLVQPFTPEETTTGGFHLLDADSEDYKKLHCIGKIVKMGPLCFNAEVFGKTRPFEIGDVVYFNRHNGMWMTWEGKDLVLLADDRISMKVNEEQLTHLDGFGRNYEEYKD